jgi:hypothetical protein
MNDGALQNALEAGCGFCVFLVSVDDKIGEFRIDMFDKVGTQLLQIDAAGAKHCDGIRIVHEGKQQMFQRGIFMPALVGERQRAMKGAFEIS